MNRKAKQICWWVFVGFCLGISPYIFVLADVQRGYDATGGEIFVPLIPLLIWVIKNSVKGGLKND
jgi:hypothetical protein